MARSEDCPTCKGRGELIVPKNLYIDELKICNTCLGSGWVDVKSPDDMLQLEFPFFAYCYNLKEQNDRK